MIEVKNKLAVNYIVDVNDENTNSKRYNLRNADFVFPCFKTAAQRHSLKFLGPQLWSKLSKRRREMLEL